MARAERGDLRADDLLRASDTAMEVVGEGVETVAQVTVLHSAGCRLLVAQA